MPEPKTDERVYREVVSRIEQEKIPLYPSIIRKKHIERYKAEKLAEIEQARSDAERKIEEERRRRIIAERERRKLWEKQQAEVAEVSEASKWKVHAGGWVRKNPDGSVSGMGMAAMSPSQAEKLGYTWGTFTTVTDKEGMPTGKFKIVRIPNKPTDAEYYGILQWKYEKGQYKHSPKIEQQIRKEIEVGGKQYGIVAPAWAGGYMKQYEATARTIKAAYIKAAESETKPIPAEIKKTTTPTPKPITSQDVSEYREIATLGQHPDVQAHIAAMQKLQTESEQLQTRGTELQRQTKAHAELVGGAEEAYKEYEKGGWTPEEVVSYSLLAGATRSIGKELKPELAKYGERVEQFETTLKQPKSPAIERFEVASKVFMELYSPSQIAQMESAMIVTFPDEKPPSPTKEPEITYGGLGSIIREGAKISVFELPEEFGLPEEPIVRPTAMERLIESGKKITGYYPEKREVVRATISAYESHQLGLADSLGVTQRKNGKRYITVNGTKYIEGTKEFDTHLGEAIQTKMGLLTTQPTEVETRQTSIQEAKRLKKEFTDIYGGKAGEPIILLTPESKKTFKNLERIFEDIPEETDITRAYWKDVEKVREVHPQIEELNLLAEQATKQGKELETIQKEKWFGVPHKVETIEEKYTPPKLKAIGEIAGAYAQVESAEDYLKAYETSSRVLGSKPSTAKEQKKIKEAWEEGQQISRFYRRMWGLSPEPYKAERFLAGYKAGVIKEVTQHPIKGAITIASFAALPPVLKGAGYLWGARAGGTAVGMAAKVPRLTKHIPKIAMGGMGIAYGGAVGIETYKAPTYELKGEVLGRTSVELAEMGAGTYMGIKLPSIASMQLRGLKTRLTRKKVPLPTITTEELATGEKKLGKVPEGMTGKELTKYFKKMQYEYGLPGEEFGHGVKVWRAAPTEYGKLTTVRRGEFEMPGMYTAPYVVPWFLRTKPPKVDVKLFGLEPAVSVTAPKPTYYRLTIDDIIRTPRHVRQTGIPSGASWFIGRGRTGKGYISIPFEYGKLEAESVLAVTGGLRRTRSKFYSTTPKGKAIPIEEMEMFKTHLSRVPVGFEGGKYYVKRPRGTAIIETKKGIIIHKGKRGEGYILPGGEIETRAVRALRGEMGKGETALHGIAREIFEEMGLSPTQSTHLFKLRGKGTALYSRPGDRQKWYSKNIYDVFKMDVKGRMKLQKSEIKDIVYYKRGMKIELSKDTERILSRYFKLKKQFEAESPKDIHKITEQIIKHKKSIKSKKHKIHREESIFKEEQDYYAQFSKKMSLISPEYLGVKGIISSTIPVRYKKLYEHYTVKLPKEEQFVSEKFRSTIPFAYRQQKYPEISYPEISYPKRGYPKVPYPPVSYPELDYPKTGYPEVPYPKTSYPEVPCPLVSYPELEIPPVSLPLPPLPPIIPPIPPKKGEKAKKYKKYTKKDPYEWFVKHPIPTLEYMFGQPTRTKSNHRIVVPKGEEMMNRVLNEVPKGFK